MAAKITPLNIKDPEVYRLAKALSERTGEPMVQVVKEALQEKFDRQARATPDRLLIESLREISDRCAALPVLDHRSDDEILGYDEHGIPS
jgi:antitoxin VapB